MEKKCRNCSTIKQLSDFHRNKNSKDGYHSICKDCANEKTSQWVSENLQKVIDNKRLRRKDMRKSLLEAAQNRARTKNLPINITIDDIVVPEFCPILKIKIEKSSGRAKANSPSLDRIIPSLGYVKGNIQVISNKANSMKNDATPEQLLNFASWIIEFFKDKNE